MHNITDYLNDIKIFRVLDKYNVSDIISHEKKVSRYALQIFDSLYPYYKFEYEERTLLYYSALLHDIGYFINKDNHKQHTKYIILKEPLLDNIPDVLRKILALIASSHGKSIDTSIDFYPLKEKTIILKLISILRIADALDHKHILHISLENVKLSNNSLNIEIKGESSNLILKKLKKRSSLFSKIYNIPICTNCF
ncbi:HD domain-containing protein [Clostridium frigoris]|uniref:HD domain-containing protein n=1 Tax=Clostridium frigoris TaxID=205327 RepID=A0ABS6BXY2_9CLOT|nr:HD domain-containing protein [Clostridium frigoris]MBU3161458.1 HD domain-containing protein [Clostridium frigoris]